ncbi:MAG: Cob(I)yrinic acid a,c-diamide adenosyltransferase [Lentisphaerae bacterium ADurb.Bin242]|nr:MAG: Cob(I)yrinic acid a,c-diamide adenosyltransferase [Lentisphaerae bacterium ADurb.Bin242]
MIHIYTGDGKGKTTAAAGLAVRALGAGLRVFFAQFIKDGSSSEIVFLKEKAPGKFIYASHGRGKFILGKPSDEDIRLARKTLDSLEEALRSSQYGLVVADEIFGAWKAGLFPLGPLLGLMRIPCGETELVLTGRDAPPEAVALADLVTEMKCVKHYYSKGRPPQRGIEM